MAGRAKRSQRLSVFLIKESFATPHAALRSPTSLERIPLKPGTPFKGEFWHATAQAREPRWKRFLAPILDAMPVGVEIALPSAILFVNVDERLLAFTFGNGRYLLRPEAIELNFGLRVALNRINPDRMRSIVARAIEHVVVTTRKQTSRSSSLATFGLDPSRELIRYITGESIDNDFATRITGRDSLTINTPIGPAELGKKAREIVDAYKDNAYEQHFPWIDQLSEVRDSVTIDKLNDLLVDTIRKGITDKLHLSPPDDLEWQSVEAFQIHGAGRREFDDLDIDEYLSAICDKRKSITLDKLKSWEVRVRWAGSDRPQREWSLYNCLVWETAWGNRIYALVEGKWFEIDPVFANTVRQFVAQVQSSSITLPTARPDESEDEYNLRVATGRTDLVCLHRKYIRATGWTSQMEFCDLLSIKGQFIFVKRKSRSATLSHLFDQGAVSGLVFLRDAEARRELRDLLADVPEFQVLIPDDRPRASDYEICYAIISKPLPNWPNALPFFSQLNLMQHVTYLQILGYNVTLTRIDEGSGPSGT